MYVSLLSDVSDKNNSFVFQGGIQEHLLYFYGRNKILNLGGNKKGRGKVEDLILLDSGLKKAKNMIVNVRQGGRNLFLTCIRLKKRL